MKKRAVIISGGSLDFHVVNEQLEKKSENEQTYIIGVDKGIEFLYTHQITADYLVGDFDSIDKDIMESYKQSGDIPIREYNPVKDASDTEMAVRLALELQCDSMVILGATGSRIDHMWANVQVLAIPFASQIEAEIIDGVNRICLIPGEMTREKVEAYGSYFSVFSLGGAVEGLTIEGAKYSLTNHKLLPFDSLSVSNQIIEERLTIRYQSGVLIYMESKDA